MADWTIFINGVHQTGVQTCKIHTTIAGSSKCEFTLSDVTKMNDIAAFSDIEVWTPTDDPPGAFAFDGNFDHIRLQNTLEMDSDNWSISFWCKRGGLHRCDTIASELSGIGATYAHITLDKPDTYYTINQVQISSSTSGTWSTALSTGIVTTDGSWHHYVIVFSATDTKLYVDNALADTGTQNTDTAKFDINYFCRGQATAATGGYLDGNLADVRVYDSVIDTDEIDNLYNGIYTTPCHAFYQMNQQSAGDYAIYDREEFSPGTSYTGGSTKGVLDVGDYMFEQFVAFKGRCDLILPDYDKDILTISGRDYSSVLLNRSIVEAYTTRLRSYIVDDIVSKYGTDLSRGNIDDSPASTEISYLFKTGVWESVVKCATDEGYRFWCDVDKAFHYHVKDWHDSDITIETGVDDILNFDITENTDSVVNKINIFGYDDGTGNQVIVSADDLDSQSYYGAICEKRIVDQELLTEDAALEFAYNYLSDHAYVAEIIKIDIIGNETLRPGDLITLKLSSVNVDGKYLIVDKILRHPDNYVTISVTKYAKNLEAVLQNLIEKILNLERAWMDDGSAVLKLHRVNEAILFTDCTTLEKRATDDSFKIGVSGKSTIGDTKIGGRGGEWTTVYSDCDDFLYDYIVDSLGNYVVDSLGNYIVVHK